MASGGEHAGEALHGALHRLAQRPICRTELNVALNQGDEGDQREQRRTRGTAAGPRAAAGLKLFDGPAWPWPPAIGLALESISKNAHDDRLGDACATPASLKDPAVELLGRVNRKRRS